ncbi:tetratricopeptide repeat protein [Aureitalea sp. L0-47]|uniref:tetratricopeptide repeat protein n=1 Tax=Aureitalea sp. L0-47 TaxID=2816962 RepID=UPI0022389315|nr:tetratricopeptide repeat protein [Aureitalea sp. L0-47]MCW5519984.1 tetratricopeptide repeat protein [Aureitalea sp. L0-47]
MKLKYILFIFLAAGSFISSTETYAQEEDVPTDDLGDVSDAFQDHFFEGLKQKGIENYELALASLRKAELAAKGDPVNTAVVQFEMGKNHAKLKQYEDAELMFKQVLTSQGERLDVLEALYDVYYEEQDYDAAIPLVEKLIKFDGDYREDLANLYSLTSQYENALSLLDELDEDWGESAVRNALRRQIYKATGDTEGAISNLEENIDKNPKKEQDYLNLIFLYSEQGDSEKAFETAKELLRNQPDSKLVHLALYKFYLDDGDIENALNSMNIVFSASEVDKEAKYRVLSDFIGFAAENPGHEAQLEAVVEEFSEENSGQVYEQLGGYFVAKGEKEKALQFYERGMTKDPDNYSLVKNTLLLQIEFSKFEDVARSSEEALEIFPAQPLLYLMNGVANIQLGETDKAIESLETGIDYLLDDPKMEKDFYEQLSMAFDKKGDAAKSANYAKRASEINIAN